METADEKLSYLGSHTMRSLDFDEIRPDKTGNWINLTNNDFDTLLPLASKETKAAKTAAKERAIFKTFSLGVATNRDEWIYDFSKNHLGSKVQSLIETYNADVLRLASKGRGKALIDALNYAIKWTRSVKRSLEKGIRFTYNPKKIVIANYRPFVKMWMYRKVIL